MMKKGFHPVNSLLVISNYSRNILILLCLSDSYLYLSQRKPNEF